MELAPATKLASTPRPIAILVAIDPNPFPIGTPFIRASLLLVKLVIIAADPETYEELTAEDAVNA